MRFEQGGRAQRSFKTMGAAALEHAGQGPHGVGFVVVEGCEPALDLSGGGESAGVCNSHENSIAGLNFSRLSNICGGGQDRGKDGEIKVLWNP